MCKISISISLAVLIATMMIGTGSFGGHAQIHVCDLCTYICSDECKQEYVDAHNEARDSVGVGPVTWDDDLAEVAQAWASNCSWEHGFPPNDYPDTMGQNLYADNRMEITPPRDVVKAWVDEKPFYNYENNTCVGGEECLHYTQVVWRNTTRIGCGTSPFLCTEVEGINMTAYVCNYSPAGNDLSQRPY